MKVDLDKELSEHLIRVRNLAIEAAEDGEEGFSARASAQSSLTSILKDIIKMQKEAQTMKDLQSVERIITSVVKRYLTQEQTEEFLKELRAQDEA